METPDGRVRTKRSLAFALAIFIVLTARPSIAQTESTNNSATRVVLVSLADRQLAVLEDGNVIARYPIAVGASDSPTPTGEFRIVSRVSHPTYYHPGTVIPAGKDNPLGTRWLGLSQKGYGIHGTNAPRSIGTAASHGCIRMRNRDVEQLFTMLHVGDAVEIRGERDEETAQMFGSSADNVEVAETQISSERTGQ